MKTANMGNLVRVGVLFTMFVAATLMLVMTHATPALATGSTAASFEADSYEFSVDENTAANTVVGTVAATEPDGRRGDLQLMMVQGQQRWWPVLPHRRRLLRK